MAIAGLHCVSALDSSILRESQSSSSGRHEGQRSSGTRASSVLQMWRELEDECVVNHVSDRVRLRVQRQNSDGLSTGVVSSNFSQGQETEVTGGLEDLNVSESGDGTVSEGQLGPQSEHGDHQSTTSELSHDIGEVERERVRQIFREWMNCGVNASNGSNFPSPRSQWLCEPELERVRVVREWIQMTSEQRHACSGNREEQATEIESQIERVRDGLVLHHNDHQPESTRRDIRRLCGRQAMLDLLAKREQERQLEILGLVESKPVSSFAFRNRIQSLLRLRILQNNTLVEHNRPSFDAAGELGLLRQRHTVSGLRQGYLSRLDNNAQVQASDVSDSSSNSGTNAFGDDETEANSSNVVVEGRSEQTHVVNQECDVPASLDVGFGMVESAMDGEGNSPGSNGSEEQPTPEHDFGNNVGVTEESATDEFDLTSVPGYDNESWQIISQQVSRSESGDGIRHAGHAEAFHDQSELGGFEDQVPDVLSQSDNLNDVSDHAHGEESITQVEDLPEESSRDHERQWEGSVLSNEWEDAAREESEGRDWPGTDSELPYATLENVGGEESHLREAYWNTSASPEENMGDWLDRHSSPGVTSAARAGSYYFPDDDSFYNRELRELLNRRTVSSLLHSGFRESLDQLIQSYVERQTQNVDDWEMQEMGPSLTMQDQEQPNTDQNEDLGSLEGSLPIQPSTIVAPAQSWNQTIPRTQRSRTRIGVRPHPGTELEVINDLRIDMARLQQRLNNMQRMLEACMDMQLELQRSVRQEVSAALNRSSSSSGAVEDPVLKDGSKWDYVRKGICCVCCDSSIDSLLYRCGHMCTCTKCSSLLVEVHGKCPMCRAPVIEVIRAYTIQ